MSQPIVDARTDDALTDDALAGGFRVWQRRRGHRYSLDDVATAWVAARAQPSARFALDLGCGLGSVLLMLAYKLPQARVWGIEAQAQSFALAERNCARNGVGDRVRLAHADLRDAAPLEHVRGEIAALGGDGCELVTGTPPYQPPGQGSVSPDSQRAHARVELRGGVEAYLAAAARVLAPSGIAVVCADARRPDRVALGAEQAGLRVVQRMDVVPALGKDALFSVFSLRPAGYVEHAQEKPNERAPDLIARDAGGVRSAQALELRRFFDLPLPAHEAPSPQLRARQKTPQKTRQER